MSTIFHATFDGKVLHPEEDINLKANTRYVLTIQEGEPEEGAPGANGNDLSESGPKDEAAFRWINEHGGEYSGEWLALDGDRLLAHGDNLSEVAAIARACGVQFPLLHLVEPPRDHPYIRS